MKQIVRPVELHSCGDHRGFLLPLESGSAEVPFEVKRVYFMYGIPVAAERGKHAHRDTRQVIVCIHGAMTISFDFGDGRPIVSYRLDNPRKGVYVEGCVWREMREFAPETVVAVLADEHYGDAAPKEMRNYDSFLECVRKGIER